MFKMQTLFTPVIALAIFSAGVTACALPVINPFTFFSDSDAFVVPPRPSEKPFSQRATVPPPSAAAQEAENGENLSRLFGGGNYSQWEAAGEEALFHGGYYPRGRSQSIFFLGSAVRSSRVQEKMQRDTFLLKIREWRRLYPESRAARIVEMNALVDRAWLERGAGFADTVSDEGFANFRKYLQQAEDCANEALAAGIAHPEIYSVLLDVGTGLSYPKQKMIDTLVKGLDIDPFYFSLYSPIANYFEEKWYGEPAEWPKLVEAATAATYTRTGNAAAFTMFFSLYRCGADLFKLAKGVKWEEVRQGFEDYQSFFPENTFAVNRMCVVACGYGQQEYAKSLFEHIGDTPDEEAWSPEMFTIWRDWALENKPKPETGVIHRAAEEDDVDAVKDELKKGVSVSIPSAYGLTPMVIAVRHKSWEVAEYLLDNGADPNSWYNDRPLVLRATTAGKPSLLKKVLKAGANPNTAARNGWTPLQEAATDGNVGVLKVLVESPGIDVEVHTEKYARPLYFAIMSKNQECVHLLVEHGANLNVKSGDEQPALVPAVATGQLDLAEYLLQKGADINGGEGDSGWSPLMAAVDSRDPARLDFVLAHGADINQAQTDGWSTLHMAAMNGDLPMFKKLVETGAKVNCSTNSGRSVLHQAIKSNLPDFVAYLLEKGADKSAKDNEGRTPLDYAKELKRTEIVGLLSGA